MSVPLAYIGVIIIWSTTPLAIKWSGGDSGFLFGVTARMLIGLLFSSALIMLLSHRRLPWDKCSRKTYLVAGIAIYGAMLSVYWGSQYISSGFISVIFGLTPIVTGIMAALWLNERSLTPAKISGVVLGVVGLFIIFSQGIQLGSHAVIGIAAVCLSVLLHSLSSVWFKKLQHNLTALEITHGGLLVSVPLYLLTWFISQGTWPENFSQRGLGSIVYLGIFGSVLGFVLFFYILKHVDVSRVSLITLITPVVALFLGYVFNNEALNASIWIGTGLIMLGMSFYQWSDKIFQR
ncbi:MAG: DMT family transporter [Gammaproteobacteria bacterium]|nr:DMT family transporter [Gammaproteobacteria bacterium]MCW8987413.1 DMT family transporter [Gammaproteobacteria bacterium]